MYFQLCSIVMSTAIVMWKNICFNLFYQRKIASFASSIAITKVQLTTLLGFPTPGTQPGKNYQQNEIPIPPLFFSSMS